MTDEPNDKLSPPAGDSLLPSGEGDARNRLTAESPEGDLAEFGVDLKKKEVPVRRKKTGDNGGLWTRRESI